MRRLPQRTLRATDQGNEACERFSEFIERALDFWSREGFDRERGLFAERLDFSARIVSDTPYRAMVQARQIYVFCVAGRESPRFGELASRVLDRILSAYVEPDFRGCAFSLAADGAVASGKQDAYTYAFVLFALAAAYRLSPEPRYLTAANGLSGSLWSRLGDVEAGGLFSDETSTSAKSQNPHMHLLEAYLALHEGSGGEVFLEQARNIVRLFTEKMFRPDIGVLPEAFSRDWRAQDVGRPSFEPGHHFEWIWLLARYDSASGENHSAYRDRLWRTALDHGLSDQSFCFDEVALADLAPVRSTRLWPHCEGVKAALAMPDDAEAPRVLVSMLRALDSFVDRPFPSGWIDRYDEHGKPSVNFVPASSLYHLHLAYTELAAARDA